jgi:hypothetical protein
MFHINVILYVNVSALNSYTVSTGALIAEIKRPVNEAVHSSPSIAGLKNAWSYTSTLSKRLHGVVLN